MNPNIEPNPAARRCRAPLALLAALAGLGLLCTVGGCNIVAAGYLAAKGLPKTPAAFELDPLRKTVIFIDDSANKLPRKALIDEIGRTAEELLLRKEAVAEGNMIASRGATLAARQDRFGAARSIIEIGQDVGAEQIIYVRFDEFQLTPDGVSFLPSATMRVKVFDVVTGDRLWPVDQPLGQSITLTMPQGQGTAPTDRAELLQAQERLANWIGVGLSQLFYEHEQRDSRSG